ncbi:type II toxin-antitoxin system VapC family toxin [Rhodopila sp.]|uniref:type II toxin-antitoxin system VapC family toxin n=1 Tax=Rhodopila sp. TaxID=2480087 RepID=UPI003D0E827A
MILDASALLAFLLPEPGKERVTEALLGNATMTTINFAEVATKYVLRGAKARAETLADRVPVTPIPVDADLALRSALMADLTRPAGLSLGDRVCLAMGQRTGHTILTADRSWVGVAGSVSARVELVR